MAAPRTGATATCAVGGRLRSATAVELLTGNAKVNHYPILGQVRFMDRLQSNGLRGLLYEFGIVLPEGYVQLSKAVPEAFADAERSSTNGNRWQSSANGAEQARRHLPANAVDAWRSLDPQ